MDAKGGGILMCKLKGQMDKGGWALCGNERVDAKGAIWSANYKGGWIRESIMMWK